MLRASSGILKQKNDSRYELASFQVVLLGNGNRKELSLLVHTPSPYEEVFVRRNAVLLFLHRFGWGFVLTVGYCGRRRHTTGRCVRLTPEVSPAAPAGPCIVLKMMSRQLPHLEYCPLHDVFDEERGCYVFGVASSAVLYPALFPGDRVIRGPDWQWGNQGECGEGTVTMVKDWKGQTGKGVRMAHML